MVVYKTYAVDSFHQRELAHLVMGKFAEQEHPPQKSNVSAV